MVNGADTLFKKWMDIEYPIISMFAQIVAAMKYI